MVKKKLTTKKKLTPKSIVSRPRREAFLSRDIAYFESHPDIKIGKKISHGGYGDIYELADNKKMVIKIPRYFIKKDCGIESSRRMNHLDVKEHCIDEEAKLYKDYDLNNEPLFIPTKIVNIGRPEGLSRNFVGLVRPRIIPIVDKEKRVNQNWVKHHITDSDIIELRRKLINVSHKGYMFWDGLQVGRDYAGRILLYDVGVTSKYPDRLKDVFEHNTGQWYDFLQAIGKSYQDYMRYGGPLKQSERY